MLLINTYFKKSFFEYLKIFAFTFIGFILVIFLFDMLELSRITSKYSLSFTMVMKLSLMKNYSSLSKTASMIVLVSSLIYFNLNLCLSIRLIIWFYQMVSITNFINYLNGKFQKTHPIAQFQELLSSFSNPARFFLPIDWSQNQNSHFFFFAFFVSFDNYM